ncbi:hypothetical protein ABFS82_14G237800 [Erythranthe guttata]|uniref:uncharacterized protein LOC105959097 n=1 Tax=Erythranthe guttata TaxID=4155 RepID=UPI00064D8FF4|nr:PREDICTED: uncharacterized protein LOC105959097 [Erythranthe guttata]|eukprot:XP_012838582.1 PREDICTED: uncharacterized protein LOC105959097 [Erythranthe guttata]
MAVAGLNNAPAFSGPSFLQMWKDLEGEHMANQYRSRDDVISQYSYENEDNNSIVSEHSSDVGGEVEGEKVRRTSREWMKSSGPHANSELNVKREWLGENECERVRIIREWVQMTTTTTTQQRNNNCGSQIEQVRDGLVITNQETGLRRPIRRICGRQTLLDLLVRAQSERKTELLALSEKRPVSDFAHRNRIQALLRGRFLRNERLVLAERPSSVAVTELGLLKQRTVSDLREGFQSKLDSSTPTSTNSTEFDFSTSDGDNGESESIICREDEVSEMYTAALDSGRSGAHESTNTQELEVQVTEAEDPASDNDNISEQDLSVREDTVSETESIHNHVTITNDSLLVLVTDSPEEFNDEIYIREEDDRIIEEQYNTEEELNEDWPSNVLQEAIDSWLDMPSADVGRFDNTLYFPDDDNIRTIELREIFSRRRVSSLLQSGFRESLNQVLQSHAERLGHVNGDNWEITDNASSFPNLIEENRHRINRDQSNNVAERNLFNPSSTHFEEFGSAIWTPRISNQQFETDWEVINELRVDMARLQQRMDDMQSMLEACMDMQVELQRSVRQEVSAALNRPIFAQDNASEENRVRDESSQWDHVRKGVCCLCQDSKIDSLLYRCGHMCTCSKCAEKLVERMGNCPMCHAPAVEAVRAYFIH